MRCIILIILVAGLAGCGSGQLPKAKVEAARKHFTGIMRPKLEAELRSNYPNLPAVSWTQEFTQHERSHNEPPPVPSAKVTGVSFHVVGTSGKAQVHIIGTYSVHTPKVVFGTISVEQEGKWRWGDFPAKPLREFGWPAAAISALQDTGSGGRWEGSHGGLDYSVHTEHFEGSTSASFRAEHPDSKVFETNSSISFSVPR